MTNTSGYTLVDSTTLITLAQSGGYSALNTLLQTGTELVITDSVVRESTTKNYPDANIIRNWLSDNSGSFILQDTQVEQAALDPNSPVGTTDAGDRSILEAANDLAGSGKINIISDDGFFYGPKAEFPSNTTAANTVEFMNGQLASGNISVSAYENASAGFEALASGGRNIPGVNNVLTAENGALIETSTGLQLTTEGASAIGADTAGLKSIVQWDYGDSLLNSNRRARCRVAADPRATLKPRFR